MKRIIILGAILILIVSCNQQDTSVILTNAVEKIPVKVAKTEARQYISSLELSGTAYADKEANLGAALPGRVEKIYYPEGSKVKKGDLLVSLSGELYTQAMAEYTTLEKDFERVSRLNKKGSISQQDYDHVKAMFDASGSKVAMMKKNAEIVAPFSGTIIENLVNEGENYFFNINFDPGYSRTSGIMRLMKLDPIQVEVEVNEKDLANIKIGQKASMTFTAVKDSVFNGKISSIKSVLSTLTHTATVKIELNNGSGIIKPGMFTHVKIALNPLNAVCVPRNAVYRQPGTADDFIFIVTDEKVKRHKINKLWTDNIWIGIDEINSDITVVTSGKEKLHDGSLIEIK